MKNSGVAALLMFSFILLRGPEELLEFVLVVVIPGVYMIGIFLLEWSVSNRKAVYKEPEEEQDKAEKKRKLKYQSDCNSSEATEISSGNRAARATEVKSKAADVTPKVQRTLGKSQGWRRCDGCGRLNIMTPRKTNLADECFCSSCRAYLDQE
jgi:hypothetical protein